MTSLELGVRSILPSLLVLLSSAASAEVPGIGSAGPATNSPARSRWEKVFVGTGSDGWVSSVHATGPDDWFVGGGWGVARSTKGTIEREATNGRAVLGLFFQSSDSVFAVGQDELILHFDGKKWIEEHVGPTPKRKGHGADLLGSAYFESAIVGAPIVAFGPWLVLVRQPSRNWTLPSETERYKLSLRGDVGPADLALPAKCEKAGWFWLGPSKGWLDCHDRRAFIVDGGVATAKGKIPRQCERTVSSVFLASGEIYASCSSATLWKTEDQKWRQIAAPKGLKEIPSISVAADCLFVASDRTVWRRCGS
jgi:hypothetical protein